LLARTDELDDQGGFMIRAFVVGLLVCLPAAAWGDVVELTSGERVEGSGIRVSPDHVTIQAGGRTLILDREKVRAVFFGAPPPPCGPGAPKP
jgi:hypothetical protein